MVLGDHSDSRYLKATSALNVSYHLLRAQSTHDKTHLLDPMHACLNVDEIVRLIASELVSEGKATTVALACCCKIFEDPALDALWETQDQILPLLRTLPEDVWNDGGCTVSGTTTCVSLSLTFLFESLLRDSRRRSNGVVSGSTLEGCESSGDISFQTTCLWKLSRSCNSVPSMNPCFRI